MTPRLATSLALVLALGLACGGLDAGRAGAILDDLGDQPPAEEIEKPTVPAPTDGASQGLAATLGLPKEGGELVLSEPEKVRIIHRDVWDVAKVWPLYHEAFVADGWERMPSNVPPFESLYEKDDVYIDLRMESGGPTVTIEIDRKPRRR